MVSFMNADLDSDYMPSKKRQFPDRSSERNSVTRSFASGRRFSIGLFFHRRQVIMEHTLKNISYIADIGDVVVISARLEADLTCRMLQNGGSSTSLNNNNNNTTSVGSGSRLGKSVKIVCHVFESEDVSWNYFCEKFRRIAIDRHCT